MILKGLAAFVAFVMGVGAVFGAMNTMYAVVASRTREIGTLRALGFSRLSILSSFVMESMFLALLAGAIGCLLALPRPCRRPRRMSSPRSGCARAAIALGRNFWSVPSRWMCPEGRLRAPRKPSSG